MSLPRLINTRQLIEFLHVDGKDPSPEVQIINNGRVHKTNLDALLNYGNWRSGKFWANFEANAQVVFYELVTEKRYLLPEDHTFVSHVFLANPLNLSITVTSKAKTKDGWIYTDNTTRFYEKAAYLHVVGLMHGVRHTQPVPNRLMDECKLTLVPNYSDVQLEFTDDPKPEKIYSRTQVDGENTWAEIDTTLIATNEDSRGDA